MGITPAKEINKFTLYKKLHLNPFDYQYFFAYQIIIVTKPEDINPNKSKFIYYFRIWCYCL